MSESVQNTVGTARGSKRIISLRWLTAQKGKLDPWIFISVLILAFVGCLAIMSASMGSVTRADVNYSYVSIGVILIKQIVFLTAGYVAMMWLNQNFSFRFFNTNTFMLMLVVLFCLLGACLLFSAVGGARGWIGFTVAGVQITIQPSEFAKIMAFLLVAAYCGDVKKHFSSCWEFVKRPVILGALIFLIVFVGQRDLGSAAVFAAIFGICSLIPKNKAMKPFQRFVIGMIIFAVVASIFILSPAGEALIEKLPIQSYMKTRFRNAVDPFADYFGDGFQIINGLIAFSSGGWKGLGYTQSVTKYRNFPAANTDFILSIVVEESGMLGYLAIMIPYTVIICRLFRYATRMKSEKGQIVLVGTAMYIAVHCLLNIGGITGLIPLTGVPLLMISAGGSSTLSLMMAIGISQAVIRMYKQGVIA